MVDEYILNQNPRTFEEKFEGQKELATLFFNRFNDLKHEIKIQLPCRVVSVNHDKNQVAVEILDYTYDEVGSIQEYPIIPNVPIRQVMDSSSAYIRLPVQIGDEGTIEFFDSSVDDLIASGVHSYDLDEDWHKINDGLFTNGFLSKNKLFTFDYDSKIVIGTKNSKFIFKINTDDELEIKAEKITITSTESINLNSTNINAIGIFNITGATNITGTLTATEVIGNGKTLSTHTHPYTDDGSPMTTGAPNS